MSIMVGTPATGSVQPRSSGLIAATKMWWAAYLMRRIEQAAIIQLNALSDRELHDIGLTRSQIEWAVRGQPDRRQYTPHC